MTYTNERHSSVRKVVEQASYAPLYSVLLLKYYVAQEEIFIVFVLWRLLDGLA